MTALLSNISSLWGKLNWKMSLLVTYELLGLFVNTLFVGDKYCFCNKKNLSQANQMQLSKNQKSFSQCFAPFVKSTSYFKQFEKKMTHIA